MEIGVQEIEPVLLTEYVIVSNDRLVVPIAAFITARHEIPADAACPTPWTVFRREIGKDFVGNRADPVRRNDVAGERSPPILRARARLARTTAQMRSQRIVHCHAVIREARSISQIGRYRCAGRREWNHLLPALVAHENEILVLA